MHCSIFYFNWFMYLYFIFIKIIMEKDVFIILIDLCIFIIIIKIKIIDLCICISFLYCPSSAFLSWTGRFVMCLTDVWTLSVTLDDDDNATSHLIVYGLCKVIQTNRYYSITAGPLQASSINKAQPRRSPPTGSRCEGGNRPSTSGGSFPSLRKVALFGPGRGPSCCRTKTSGLIRSYLCCYEGHSWSVASVCLLGFGRYASVFHGPFWFYSITFAFLLFLYPYRISMFLFFDPHSA